MDYKALENIPKNIKKYRLANKLTQEQLAEKLNLDTQYYAQLERGERNFTIDKIVSACLVFNIGIEDIVEITPIEQPIDTSPMIERLMSYMKKLNVNQLSSVEKFIVEITPYIK